MSASTLFIPWCSQPAFSVNGFSSVHATTTSQYQISAFRARPSPLGTAWSQDVMSGMPTNESESQSPFSDENALKHAPRATKSDPNTSSTSSPFSLHNISPFRKSPEPAQASTLTPAVPSFTTATATAFRYESRARSQSPSVRLQDQKVAARETRKHQFLARLRSRRDDAQFDRNGEQLLRIDWMKERRAWEQQMARTGNAYQSSSVHPDMYDDGEEQNDHESDVAETPVDDHGAVPFEEEEEEIQDLVSRFEQMDEDDDVYSDSGDEYDALFTEVLSQEHSSTARWPNRPRDSDMDMT